MSTARDIWAVVPMKVTTAAKQRLADALPAPVRQKLALAMFTDVMTALVTVQGLAGIAVVTVDPAVRAIAERYAARIIEDGAHDGHTGAVMAAARLLAHEKRGGFLTMPGDIPLVTPGEIETILAAHPPAPAVTIVPAHDGRGSNAVLLSPPDVMPLKFGDDSFVPHRAEAMRRGLALRRHDLFGIGLDIDTPADLARFLTEPRRTHAVAVLAAL